MPAFSRTETLLALKLATARSGLPSLLRAALIKNRGPLPAVKSVFGPKPPPPFPSRTETVLELKLATAR